LDRAAAAAPVSERSLAATLGRFAQQGNILLPGLYAWLTTVAYPATQRGASGFAKVTAFAALLALVSGPIVALERPRIGRAIGLLSFVGLSLATWLALGSLLGIQRLEPMRASLGSVGWALFAFGWGDVRRAGSVPEDDPNFLPGPRLPARDKAPPLAMAVFLLGVLGAMVPLFLAWRELRPRHALLAHAAALLWAVALVTAAARIAVGRSALERVEPARLRVSAAVRPLVLLTLALGLGLLWQALR
jgi:hypothetical protein